MTFPGEHSTKILANSTKMLVILPFMNYHKVDLRKTKQKDFSPTGGIYESAF